MNENEVAAAPMQIRAEPPRVTRLSRTLIYALQTSETGRHGDELYSTSNRQPADGLASLPRDRSWAAAAWRSWPADA